MRGERASEYADGPVAASTLTWALCVATRNRPHTLLASLHAGASQQPPPAQIIIVDSSDDSRATHQVITVELASEYPDIEWTHEPSDVASLTLQRQRTIELSTTDIVFTFDDDTVMYPDCAAAILEIYAADATETVAGIEATEWPGPPRGAILDDSADPLHASSLVTTESSNPVRRIASRVIDTVLMFDPALTFVPYGDGYWNDEDDLAPAISRLDAYAVPLMQGYRMTYRRAVVAGLVLEPLFRGYTPMEDFDASYRASQQGALVASMRAGVYHHRALNGRLGAVDLNAKSVLNLALLLRRHAEEPAQARQRYLVVNARRLFANMLRDLARGRMSFPWARGVARGTREGWAVLRADDESYEDRYRALQEPYLQRVVGFSRPSPPSAAR